MAAVQLTLTRLIVLFRTKKGLLFFFVHAKTTRAYHRVEIGRKRSAPPLLFPPIRRGGRPRRGFL
jgi:hypothetical protein